MSYLYVQVPWQYTQRKHGVICIPVELIIENLLFFCHHKTSQIRHLFLIFHNLLNFKLKGHIHVRIKIPHLQHICLLQCFYGEL